MFCWEMPKNPKGITISFNCLLDSPDPFWKTLDVQFKKNNNNNKNIAGLTPTRQLTVWSLYVLSVSVQKQLFLFDWQKMLCIVNL